jgi:WD40 repeat protein/Flp pilus assembly protein TadD
VAFSLDGKRLASAHGDKTVRLWDVSTKQVRVLNGHRDTVFCVSFSPDGKRLATGSRDGTVLLWDPDADQPVRTLDASADVRSLAFSPDGRLIAAGTYGSLAKVWETTGHEVCTYRVHARAILGIAFSPDGRRLASGDSDGFIKIWNPRTASEVDSIRGRGDVIRGVAFSPDGRCIASAEDDAAVRIRDATVGQEAWSLSTVGYPSAAVYRMAFSPDGRQLAIIGGLKGRSPWKGIGIHQIAPNRPYKTFPESTKTRVTCVAWHPYGKRLASGAEDHTVRLWDVATGREILAAPASGAVITDLAFSPDGNTLAWTSLDGLVRVWDCWSGQAPREIGGHNGAALAVAFLTAGRQIASVGADGTLKVRDAARGNGTRTPHEFLRALNLAVFSPGGNQCAAVSGDGAVRALDLQSGKNTVIDHPHAAPITALAFSPDGSRIATSSEDQTIKVWDAATGHQALVLRIHPDAVASVAFSPDGRRLIRFCNGVSIFDAEPKDQEPKTSRIREAEARAPSWHLAELYASSREGNWFAAVHHLDQLIALQPGRWDHHAYRGWANGHRRLWDAASADYERATELGPQNADVYFGLALLQLRKGNISAYRATCASAVERFGRARDGYTLSLLTRTCMLAPTAMSDSVHWAKDAVAARPRDPDLLNTLGLALYRAGRFDECARRVAKAVAIPGGDGSTFDRLFLAMAHAGMGRPEAARSWLAKVLAVSEASIPAATGSRTQTSPEPLAWTVEIELDLLRREAEALIRAPDLPADAFAH